MKHKINFKILILLAVLAGALAFFFFACVPKKGKNYPDIIYPDEYVEGQDFNPTAYYAKVPNVAAVTDDGIYFKAGEFLYYADNTTLKARPLCFKVNCLHVLGSAENIGKCNAFCYTPEKMGFVGVFRDRIFYSGRSIETGNFEFYTADLDGANRRVFLEDMNSIIMDSVRIHRGTLYFPRKVVDLDGNIRYTMSAVNLQDGKDREEVLFDGSIVSGSFTYVLPYGNYIYYNEDFLVEDEKGNKRKKHQYSRYHILDGTREVLTELTDMELFGIVDGKPVLYDSFDYYDLDPEKKEMSISELGIQKFQEEHRDWTCLASSVADGIGFFTCSDNTSDPPGEPIWQRIIVNENGKEVCSLEEANFFNPENTSQLITIKGEEYYLHFAASIPSFTVELYKVEDLLAGKTNSKRLIPVTNLNNLYPGYYYKMD